MSLSTTYFNLLQGNSFKVYIAVSDSLDELHCVKYLICILKLWMCSVYVRNPQQNQSKLLRKKNKKKHTFENKNLMLYNIFFRLCAIYNINCLCSWATGQL